MQYLNIFKIFTILRKVLKFPLTLLSKLIFRLWIFIAYFIIYPHPFALGNTIYIPGNRQKTFWLKLKRHYQIYNIRFTNIETSFYANAGAIFALVISILSILLSLESSILVEPFKCYKQEINLNFLNNIFNIFLSHKFQLLYPVSIPHWRILILSMIFTYFFTAFFLRKILDHLSPEVYANSSLINLNKSDLLTFIAYKNWYLLYNLLEIKYVKKRVYTFSKCDKFIIGFRKLLGYNDNIILDRTNALIAKLEQYHKDQYKHIQQCIFLVTESSEKLGINKRELVNHLLKFSPAIFESNLSKSINSLKLFIHLYDNSPNKIKSKKILYDLYDYIYELKKNHLKYLEQIIFHEDVHNYIIGLASTTSASLSLKIFLRGISEIAQSNEVEFLYNSKLDTILHRSKAHCGIDLNIQYNNIALSSKKIKKINTLPHIEKNINKGLRVEFNDYEKKAQIIINELFNSHFSKINQSNTYLIIFGSSELILNNLKSCIKVDSELKIFVFQEDNIKSLDTRIFRYELGRSNKTSIASFTAKDHVITNLITNSDNVIFIAGIEIYCRDDQKLFHTNNYQSRVEGLMQHLKDRYINKQIWLVGESYKIHDSVSSLDNNFFNDHYTTLDLYDLKKYFSKDEIVLISDK